MARQVATAAINTIRDSHYEGALATPIRTLLVELASTNLLLRSQELDNVAWSPSSANIIADTAVAPDGTATADTINVTVANGGLNQVVAKAASAIPYSFSVYLKALVPASGSVDLFFGVSGSYVNGAKARFDLVNGVISVAAALNGAGWSAPSATITPLANGWYRCTLNVTSDASATVQVGIIGPSIAPYLAWGGQLETFTTLSFATSYIPTVAATVTRAADLVAGPFLLGPQETTFYCKFIEKGSIFINGAAVFRVGGVGAPAISISSNGTFYAGSHHNGVGNVTATLGIAPVIGDTVEHRLVLSITGSISLFQSINGAAETTIASGVNALAVAWGTPTINIGNSGVATVGAFATQSMKAARGTKTLAQMQAY